MRYGHTDYNVFKDPDGYVIEPGGESPANHFDYEDDAEEEAEARTLQSKVDALVLELDIQSMEFSPVGTRKVSINGLVMTNEEAHRSMSYLVNLKRENEQ